MQAHAPGTGSEQRRNALRAILACTLPLSALLLLSNLRFGADGLAGVNLTLLLVSAALLVAVFRRVATQTLALTYLIVLFGNIVATLTVPNIQPGADTSLALIPVLSYLLLDAPLALPVALSGLVAALAAFFAGAWMTAQRLNPRLIGHVMVPVIALFVLCHVYARSRTRSVDRMLDQALRDPLTGLWNRDKLTETFDHKRQRSLTDGTALALVLLDLDHFKTLNDRRHHDRGDH